MSRGSYQCLREKNEQERGGCSHEEAPGDRRWGVQGRRTSPGVQKLVSAVAASMTLEETVQVCERVVPLGLSARQALNVFQPIAEGLAEREKQEVKQREQAACQARTQQQKNANALAQQTIWRSDVERDGVSARLRRECMVLSPEGEERTGEVSREINLEGSFLGETGPRHWKLVPGVLGDRAGTIASVAHTPVRCGPFICGSLTV